VNTQELTLFHLLKEKGLSYDDFKMVFFTDNLALGQALINNDIDVATVVQPYAAQVVAQADGAYLGNNQTAWGAEAPDCMVTVKESVLAAQPEWLPRYLSALLAAEDAFASDPAAAIAVLGHGKYFKVEGKPLEDGLRRQPPQVRLPGPALAALEKGVGDMRDLGYVKSLKGSDVLNLSLLGSVS
ncbi:MAG: ABC transporter substrate-binding protein, partial [Acidimicrobiales bacterium]